MGHIVAARELWLFRFGLTRKGPSDFFPVASSLSALRQRVANMQMIWTGYLKAVRDEDLERLFEYQSLEGGWYRSKIEDVLVQLFGHSWYHRGQIASLLASLGAQAPVTDFIFWTREEISAPAS